MSLACSPTTRTFGLSRGVGRSGTPLDLSTFLAGTGGCRTGMASRARGGWTQREHQVLQDNTAVLKNGPPRLSFS